jgi:DNA-binding beta-propeller fold protein YncE
MLRTPMLRTPSPVAAVSPLLRAAALALLLLTAAGCGDDDGNGDDPSLAEPTPTRAPRTPGPGLGNLAYSDAELFVPAGFVQSPEGHGNATMIGGYLMALYSSDGGGSPRDGGIDFWDVSDPRAPRLAHRHENADTHQLREIHGFGVSTSYPMDVAAFQSIRGVQFWDFTDPAAISLLSEIELPHIDGGDYIGIWWLFFQAPYVYAAGVGEGLYVIDASDPLEPELVQWLGPAELGGVSPGQVFAIGNLLVIAEHQGAKIATLDISDPERPVLLEAGNGAFGYAHFFSGGNLYTSGGVQVGALLPIIDGEAPLRAPTTMGITRIGHDGAIEFSRFGAEGASLEAGGYGTVQDGFFISGFSNYVAKFDIASGAVTGVAASGFDDADEDFGVVLGNLIFSGNDHGQGSALIPHQVEPDTTPPSVDWIHPADGAVNQAPTSRIGFTAAEQIDIYSVDGSTFTVRPVGGRPVPGKYSVQLGTVNFAPEAPLRAGTQYEVRIDGIRDLAGNAGAPFVSRFRVGGEAPPTCRLAEVDTGLEPAFTGEPVTLRPVEVKGRAPLRFTWSFDDASESETDAAEVTHTWTFPGRYTVVLTVADRVGRSSCSAVQIVRNRPSERQATASSTIVHAGGSVFNVNPDNDTLTSIDAASAGKRWEVAVGAHPRSVAVAPDGSLWVTLQDDAAIAVVDAASGALLRRIELPHASQPFGIAFAPDGSRAFVALQARRELVALSPAGEILGAVALPGRPRGVAVTPDSRRVLVTRFVSGPDVGEVWSVAADLGDVRTITLHYDEGPDTEKSGRGVPNYLTTVRISPDGTRAVVPSKKDNTARGLARDGQELTFESRVRTIVSQIDLVTEREIPALRSDLNDRDMAQAAVFSPLGDIFFVATQGSNTIEVLDTYRGAQVAAIVPNQFEDIEGVGPRLNGLAPQGLAIDPDGRRLFVHNFLSRSVSVYDVEALVRGTRKSARLVREVKAVASEKLSARAFAGKRIFYNASDPRMSRDGYLSCASCHLDGGSDGRVWDFTQVGEGLRNTIDLVGKAGLGHGKVHWSANFDEIQDFENDMRFQFGGRGFMRDNLFAQTEDPLGPPKARKSGDLDNLALFLASLDRFPNSPWRNADGSLTPAGERGRAVFFERACWTCHAGTSFTDGLRHDVGTLGPDSGLGIGLPLEGVGIDTPTLLNLWDTDPYLHDGSALTLVEAFAQPEHLGGPPLSAQDEADLVEYLLQIDAREDATP